MKAVMARTLGRESAPQAREARASTASAFRMVWLYHEPSASNADVAGHLHQAGGAAACEDCSVWQDPYPDVALLQSHIQDLNRVRGHNIGQALAVDMEGGIERNDAVGRLNGIRRPDRVRMKGAHAGRTRPGARALQRDGEGL